MSFQIRKAKILGLLEQAGGAVDVRQLAASLDLSDMTVRRDLNALAEQGLIIRTHGGAMLPGLADRPVSFAGKSAQQHEAKEQIARRAAAEIVDGDVIFMDCGSTVFALCPYIRQKRITVITNSLPVVAELMRSNVTLNLVGGEVDKERQAVHGLTAESHIARYRADKAFVGVDGVSVANGLSANGEKEATLTLALMRQAAHTYLLCDASKLGQDRYLQFAPLSVVEVLVTDPAAPDEVVQAFVDAGVRVIR
ncbi:DeoR family transcriptional regulator [Rudanella paleaurantiibacter]|uniref:DeoR family transcriptional regulator n=1 Tax=Rudanella paleaurantiibacter TaxID=2614655 RepID=A0A7J5U664_9BACT|nr:DeoR/GlpR family DNA-binding transcription regulator [Rudanella paleaurantiibacter]KAB7733173.1 DeoR family transcriptional regulator [Rudanella paleaurantiibacter]